MLIWSLCVKGLLFILYHNQNGSKIEIVSSVYDDLNNFLMEKAFDYYDHHNAKAWGYYI